MSASFRQQLLSLEQRVRELAQIIGQRKGEISSFIARKAQAESEIADSRGKMEKLSHDRAQVNAQAAELLGRKQAQDADVVARDESLREQRRDRKSVV